MSGKPGVRGWLVDLDGVLYDADRLVAGAADTVRWLHDIQADVGGAQRAGLRGVLVKTGKFRPADLEGRIRPHMVFDSIADLPRWWAQNA